MTFALIFLFSFFTAAPEIETWQCQNPIEISCDSEDCKAEKEGAFTPMSINFDETGLMSVCAYTGCWEGTGKVHYEGANLFLNGQKMTFSTAPENEVVRSNISIMLDRSDKIGFLKAGSFAHPIVCELVPKGD